MTKRLQLFALLIAVCALCYSQGAAGNNALFLSGGYRLNGGEYELSAGYERLLTGRSSFYSLYTSFNYQQIETTMVGNMTAVSNSLAEVGARRYFLKNGTSVVSPFIGAGVVMGNSHIRGNENQGTAYPKTQDIFNYGGAFSLGSEFFIGNSFSLSIIGKYMYDSEHHLFASFGAKYYF